jgi:hypothetical protein
MRPLGSLPLVDTGEAGMPGNWADGCEVAGMMPLCMVGVETALPVGFREELVVACVIPGSVIRADWVAAVEVPDESTDPGVRAGLPQADAG